MLSSPQRPQRPPPHLSISKPRSFLSQRGSGPPPDVIHIHLHGNGSGCGVDHKTIVRHHSWPAQVQQRPSAVNLHRQCDPWSQSPRTAASGDASTLNQHSFKYRTDNGYDKTSYSTRKRRSAQSSRRGGNSTEAAKLFAPRVDIFTVFYLGVTVQVERKNSQPIEGSHS